MRKQQKYRIEMDMQNHYRVVLRSDGSAVYESINTGKAGLEDCQDWLPPPPHGGRTKTTQDWLAHQPQEE